MSLEVAESLFSNEDQLFLRIQRLIDQREQRRQQELSLWFDELSQEFDIQRQANQQHIEQELSALDEVYRLSGTDGDSVVSSCCSNGISVTI